MHLHAFQLEFAAGAPACAGDQGALLNPIDPAQEFTPGALIEGCRAPIFAPDTDDALVNDSLAQLDRLNIRRAVTSGAPADVARSRTAGGVRVIPAIGFGTSDNIGVDALRQMHARGEAAIFAEISTQYRGVSADDARYEPFTTTPPASCA